MTKTVREPNFFIVGAAKSGTTSLVHYLSQHPDVYFSLWKEPHYFVSEFVQNDFDEAEYLSLFNGAGDAKSRG